MGRRNVVKEQVEVRTGGKGFRMVKRRERRGEERGDGDR